MSETVEVNYLLTAEVGRLQTDLSRIETSIMRILSYLKQFGVGTELDFIINKFQQLITVARSLQIVLMSVRLAMSPVGGPTAWLYAGTAGIGTGFAIYDSLIGR